MTSSDHLYSAFVYISSWYVIALYAMEYGATNPSYFIFICCVCIFVQNNIAVTHHLGNKATLLLIILLLFYTSACCQGYIPPWRLLSCISVSGHTLKEGYRIAIICGVAIYYCVQKECSTMSLK